MVTMVTDALVNTMVTMQVTNALVITMVTMVTNALVITMVTMVSKAIFTVVTFHGMKKVRVVTLVIYHDNHGDH